MPAGAWRWAALIFLFFAIAAAALAVMTPEAARWAGMILLVGIGAVASILLYAVRPKETLGAQDARRIAEAAARANVAWAITGMDGAVLNCNEVYRRMSGASPGESAPPPELALAGEPSTPVLYRLTRAAADAVAREESFIVAPGLEVVAAVRPLSEKQTAWWFTPRLAPSAAHLQAVAAQTPATRAADHNAGDMFRDAPMGMAFVSNDGRLSDTNRAFANFFGTQASLTGRSLPELVEQNDRAGLNGLLAKNVAGSVEIRLTSNSERMAELFAQPLKDGRIVLYLLDVTEQKALETKFAQSQKLQAVGQLAGGVAHDFNNLLTVIIGNSEFLLMRHHAADPSFKEINEIHQNALRAATLVGQLLAFSRKQTLQPKVLAVRDVIGDLAILLKRLLREGVDLALDQGQRSLAHSRRRGATLERDHQSRCQRARRDAERRHSHDPHGKRKNCECGSPRHRHHATGRLRPHRCGRHRHRHLKRTSGQDFRSVFHDQACGARYRAWPRDRLRHRQADRWFHHGRQRSGPWHNVPNLSAALSRR
ncbi:MAG: PAS domain-containing protein [Rhizomicrobium sp.]